MPIIGTPRTFAKRFAYVVEIDGFGVGPAQAGFSKVSELSVEAGVVAYREGGRLIPHKSPGLLTFADVTLERGATQDRALYTWFLDVARASSGVGLREPGYKRNVDIVQQDRDGSTLRRWTLFGAWPMKFVAGEWDASSDEVVIESVTLAIDYFELST